MTDARRAADGGGPRPVMLGVIADDVTGGADLAGMLTSKGVRTLMCVDRTEIHAEASDRFDAIVIALKTRAVAPDEAVARSRAALDALLAHGVRQVFFKYCSTFDSTAAGNIGPVLDALMAALEVPFSSLVPALPINGRTQYLGHLFVEGRLLSESSLRDHPLNPMRDANLVRHLQPQTRHRVGLVPLDIVRRGAASIRQTARDGDVRLALVDAIDERDVCEIAEAFFDHPLVSGSSGLALALPDVWRTRGLWQPEEAPPHAMEDATASSRGPTLILCGSCSSRTREQVRHVEQVAGRVLHVDIEALAGGASDRDERDADEIEYERLLAAVCDQLRTRNWSLVASCAGGAAAAGAGAGAAADRAPALVSARLAPRIEALLARLARVAVDDLGVRSLVVAGGETSGAVAAGLNLQALRVGPQLDPGVPICMTRRNPEIAVVLKSGNFGRPDLFTRALRAFGHQLLHGADT